MAFTAYHNITGSTGVDVELIAPESNVNTISSIMITNTHATADATVSLFLNDASAGKKYYIIHTIALPADSSLYLDEKTLSFDNSINGLYLTVGASDTLDVLISK